MFIESLRARIIITVLVLLAGIAWTLPNFVNFGKDDFWVSKDKINYGLDIQGGLHIVMGVGVDDVIRQQTKFSAESFKTDFKNQYEKEIQSVETGDLLRGEMTINAGSPELVELVEKYISEVFFSRDQDNYRPILQVIESTDTTVKARYFEPYIRGLKKQIVERTVETLRNRIDAIGLGEPNIAAQGNSRVIVQLPGLKSEQTAYAKDIIKRTAKLAFIIASQEPPANLQEMIDKAEETGGFKFGDEGLEYKDYLKKLNEELAKTGKLPKDTYVYFQKAPGAKTLAAGRIPWLLEEKNKVGGENLASASATFGEGNQPIVSFRFNAKGTGPFADLTRNHVNRSMAIVLDGVVQSAPNIESAITQGSGQITMGGAGGRDENFQEAKVIATVLRAGALPADLIQLEERTVGPSLGQDSIDRGKMAGLLGAILVLVFMLIYYKGFGLVANLALSFNILLILAILTSLGATLTLPGVAGIVLTVGMAVDANVIIFERIKEELAKGSALTAAVREGYARAFSAIFDANITTGATCIVLMYFGTGPVRGFAVTLIIGIVTSMFTAIFVSRALVDVLVQRLKMKLAI